MAKRHKKGVMGFVPRLLNLVSTLWHNKFWIMFIMLVAVVFFAWYSAQKRQTRAQATLMLQYERAYEGLNPNGTRFNIHEILNDEVLTAVIDKAGLTGELSVDDLLASIQVSASGSQSAKNMYIATEYFVSLTNEFLPARISAESMLRLLMETYKQYFLQHYGTNDSALEIDWSDVEKWEYIEFSNIMNVNVNNLITYLNDLRNESGMSQYRIKGESFRSLSESIINFRDIYLNKYTSYVAMNHLFRSPAQYRSKLEYRQFLNGQKLKENEEMFDIYQDALAMYDEAMITFVMVPMYDVTNGLYMARTDIGMDDLTENSQAYSEKIEVNAQENKTFEMDVLRTRSPGMDAEKRLIADRMIEEIESHLDSIISRVRLVKNDYEQYRSKNSIYYSMNKPGLMSGYDLKGAVVVAGLTFIAMAVYYYLSAARKQENTL